MFIFEIAYNKLAQAHTKQISNITINSPYNNKYNLTRPLDVDLNMDLQDDHNYLSDLDDEMQDHTSDDEEATDSDGCNLETEIVFDTDSVINLCI